MRPPAYAPAAPTSRVATNTGSASGGDSRRGRAAATSRIGGFVRAASRSGAVIAFCVVVAVGGCAHAPEVSRAEALQPLTAEQLLAIASAAEQLGDRLRAQQYLHAARQAGADPELVLRRSLRLYVADGQYRIAIDTVREHLRSRPQQARLRLLLAELYEATQLDAQALDEYEHVLQITPSEPRAHFALATLLHERGHDPARADRHYRAYLELAPHGPDAAEARSHLLQEMP